MDKKILVVYTDSQGNISTSLGMHADEFINNIYEFKGGTNIFDVCDTIPEVNYIMREINSIDMS